MNIIAPNPPSLNFREKILESLKMKQKMNILILTLLSILIVGCTSVEEPSTTEDNSASQQTTNEDKGSTQQENSEEKTTSQQTTNKKEETKSKQTETSAQANSDLFKGYKLIEVDGGDLSGHREPNVVVNIGFGDREYWAFTNEYGQLIRVVADEIILQDDRNEPVLSNGRYYPDEAKVPGVERKGLDEGHIIADSLGGVSNAYNITPQNSTLNRHGDQAYMEEMIRKAGGATNFEAIITYPDTKTQIPSSYQYTYTIKGQKIVDKFDNVDPDKVNESLGLTGKKSSNSSNSKSNNSNQKGDISSIDTNGDGQVTIKEAKAAGFKMPITKDHWLYPYMDDRDGDGMVGE